MIDAIATEKGYFDISNQNFKQAEVPGHAVTESGLTVRGLTGSGLTAQVPFRVSQLSSKLNAHAARILREKCGLSLVQWRILTLLTELGPSGMDAGLFSRNMRSLVDNGLIKSSPDKKDQRQARLSITSAGRTVFENSAPTMQARREALLEGVTEKEKKAFFMVLDKLDRNASLLAENRHCSGNQATDSK